MSRFLIQELKVNFSYISVWLTHTNNIIDLKLFNKTELINIVCQQANNVKALFQDYIISQMLVFPISSCIVIRLVLACLGIHGYMFYFPFHIQRLPIQ